MKKSKIALILVVSAFLQFFLGFATLTETSAGAEVCYWVSADGQASAVGTKEDPFPTPEVARDAIRNLRETSGLPDGGITVYISEGTYEFLSPFSLTRNDSGTENCTITYKAVGNVRFVGGIALRSFDFRHLTEEEKVQFLHPDAVDRILVNDLGDILPQDAGEKYHELQFLSVNGRTAVRAGYPNEGFVKIKGASGDGASTETYKDMEQWKNADGMWAVGYLGSNWSFDSCRIERVSSSDGRFYIDAETSYGVSDGGRIAFVNVLDELDCENEYYIDHNARKLYYYPGDGFETSEIAVAVNTGAIIENNADFVVFDGIDFSANIGNVFESEGNDITVRNCGISAVSGWGIICKGFRNVVENCSLSDLGQGGIDISGGDARKLIPAENRVFNCTVDDFAKLVRTYQAGIQVNGNGIAVSHNRITNSPHEGIEYGGSDLLFKFNEIGYVCKETGDAGAVYAGRRWDWNNCVFRYNYIHHVGKEVGGPSAIYWDDALSGQRAYGNVIYSTFNKGFHIGGGRNNYVVNNIIIDAGEQAVSYDARAAGSNWGRGLATYASNGPWSNLMLKPYKSKLWQNKYPFLSLIKETDVRSFSDFDMAGNNAYSVVKNNVFCKCKADFYIGEPLTALSTIRDNLSLRRISDAGFEDYEAENFRLRADSVVFYLLDGFENIPFEKIGPVQ